MGLLGGGFGWASLKKGSGGLVRRRIRVSFIGERFCWAWPKRSKFFLLLFQNF